MSLQDPIELTRNQKVNNTFLFYFTAIDTQMQDKSLSELHVRVGSRQIFRSTFVAENKSKNTFFSKLGTLLEY